MLSHTHTHAHTHSQGRGGTCFPLLNLAGGFRGISSCPSGLPGGPDGEESACSVENPCVIPGWGRCPGGNGSPLWDSCLENPMDRGAWWATVHGVTQSWTRLSDSAYTHIGPLSVVICYHRHFFPPPNFNLEESKVTQKGAMASSPASAWLLASCDSHPLPPHRCPDFCPSRACLSHDRLSSS